MHINIHTNQHNIHCEKLKCITFTTLSTAWLKWNKILFTLCYKSKVETKHVWCFFLVFSDCCGSSDWIMIINIIQKKTLWSRLHSQHKKKVCSLPHKIPRSFWYSFGRSPKYERSHPVFFKRCFSFLDSWI